MRRWCRLEDVLLLVVTLGGITVPSPLVAQDADAPRRLLPGRAWLPTLHAGPRDPVTKAELPLVTNNPSLMGDGIEAELALGVTLPLYVVAGDALDRSLVVGVEGGVFARFALQLTERELVNSDWVFAVPIVWRHGEHWLRLRYYHTSSHLGDEYSRRFEVSGFNFARDAVELLGYARLLPLIGAYAGSRWAYTVHPEESGRWVARGGVQLGDPDGPGLLLPFGSVDVELDDDNDWSPRWYVKAGAWVSNIGGRRAIRLNLGFLTGPSPLGQFRGTRTTQWSLGIEANL